MGELRILIADDHEIVRRGISELLRVHDGWRVCGEARVGTKSERQDGRDSSGQCNAQTRFALDNRSDALCYSQEHYSGSGVLRPSCL